MNQSDEFYAVNSYSTKPFDNLGIWLGTLPKEEQWHFLAFQPAKLIAENAINPYYLLMTNFDFIEAKLKLIGITPLLLDYALGITNIFVTTDMKMWLKVVRDGVEQLGKLYQEYPVLYTEWIEFCKTKGISPQIPYCTGIPFPAQKTTLLQVWLQEKHPDFAVF